MAKRPAKTNQERQEKAAAKAKAMGVITLRLPAMQGTRDKLEDLMRWHGFTVSAEAMTIMIENFHALGAEGSAHLFAVPRHEIVIPERAAKQIEKAGKAEADRLDKQEDSYGGA